MSGAMSLVALFVVIVGTAALFIGLMVLWFACVSGFETWQLRRQAIELERRRMAEELIRIEREAAASVGRIEAAYWQAQQEIWRQATDRGAA
ncbi:hypothetical protein AB0G00_09985 [Nocardia salmonicida]|uniref:hypothetical protein n=1 Tax=Nocardia salmonicida TaxID=53431 RepID=UPI0033CB0677